MEVLGLKGVSLIRFVTKTQGWGDLARNHVCVPDKWPFMIVELLVADNGEILLSTAVGIPKSSLTACHYQGLYYYDFDELPESVVSAVINHFKKSYRELLKRVNTLLPETKPRLTLVK